MLKCPLVSVVIPTYNKKNISDVLESVKIQTYNSIEIIVVDDNKNNSVSEKLKKSISKYNVKYIKNKKNIGGALSRNVGIDNAHGEFIAFLDDDDSYMKDKISKQLEFYYSLNNNKVAVITCNTLNYLDDQYTNKEKHISVKNSIVGFISNKTATTSTWLAKKSCLLDVGGFTDIKAHQEGLLMIKLLSEGYESYNLNEYLIIRNKYTDRNHISNLNNEYIETTKKFIEESKKYLNKLNNKEIQKVYFQYHSILFHLYYLNNRYDEAVEEFKCLCKYDLFNIIVLKKIIRLIMLKRRIKHEKG